MRIALLSYRSKPHCGGQGVYVRHLSRELVALGHDVEVLSGQPYPVLDPGVRLTEVPSLDLYREPDPFRTPRPGEIRDLTDLLEVATMWTAGFPEPRTFSRRVARLLRSRLDDFDVVHDNQTLGDGMLEVQRAGLPLVTTIHHPITFDRRVDLAAATSWRQRLTLRRWYGFLRMQGRVARRMQTVLVPSESSARDVVTDFGVDRSRITVIPLGVDDVFRPPSRAPGARPDRGDGQRGHPDEGDRDAAGGVRQAAHRARRGAAADLAAQARRPDRADRRPARASAASVRFVHGITDEELAAMVGSAEIACVPSLYEGFSLPTVEAMACATPLVVSRAGAIPEVVGPDGLCADLVTPGDVGELAHALAALLDDPERRARMGAAGRERALAEFSWRAVAEATVRPTSRRSTYDEERARADR